MADNLNNFKELNFKICNLDLGRQYITVSRTIKPQEDLIFLETYSSVSTNTGMDLKNSTSSFVYLRKKREF